MAGTDIPQPQSDADFYKEIQPALDALEVTREEYSWKLYRRMIIGGVAGLIVAAAFAYCAHHAAQGNWMYYGIAAACLFAVGGWVYMPAARYHTDYKNSVLPRIVKLVGLSGYNPHGAIYVDQFEPTGIVPGHDKQFARDLFEGTYKGAGVSFCRLVLKKKNPNLRNNQEETVFSGIALLIVIPQNKFSGHTVVRRKNLLNELADINAFKATGVAGLQTVHLEDPAFEKRYQVFSTDQVESRVLLDPAMMERIDAVSGTYFSQGINISYDRGNRVFALIPTARELFNAPSVWSPTDIDAVERMKKEVQSILSLVDQLDLYKPPVVGTA